MRIWQPAGINSLYAALTSEVIKEIDNCLEKKFILTKVDDLEPIGIDRILFLQMTQFSAFYYIDHAGYGADGCFIPLSLSDGNQSFVQQSLAQWLFFYSIPNNSMFLISMSEFKLQVVGWKKKFRFSKNGLSIPVSELYNMAHKHDYDVKLPHSLKMQIQELKWRDESDQLKFAWEFNKGA